MEKDIMTTLEFKTVMEMVVLIIENSKNKEEALEKIKNLSILKELRTKRIDTERTPKLPASARYLRK